MSQQKNTEIVRIFSERLRSRMARLNVQANELADKLEVAPSAVSNWLAGSNSAKGRNLRRLAEELNCSPDWLLGGGSSPDFEPHTLRESSPESETQVWRRRAIDAERRLAIIREDIRRLYWSTSPNPPPQSGAPPSLVEPSDAGSLLDAAADNAGNHAK